MSIAIENPRTGEASHTSRNRATYLIQTQQAFMTEEGALHLLSYERTEYYKRSGEAFWWNGSWPKWAMKMPGEVRS